MEGELPEGTKGAFGLEDLRNFSQIVDAFVAKGDLTFLNRRMRSGRSAVEVVFRVASRVVWEHHEVEEDASPVDILMISKMLMSLTVGLKT